MKKILLSLTLLLFMAGSAQAASLGGLGIFPANPDPSVDLSGSWFIYNLVPGEEKQDVVNIQNTSEETLSAKVYAVDATTTSDGAFALLNEGDSKTDMGAWVDLPISEITLAPGESRQVPFTVNIPSGASVGSHLGGIVLHNLKTKEGKGVDIVTRVGVRIYETVPGNLVRLLDLTDLSWKLLDDKVNLVFNLENKGNVHLDLMGKITYVNALTGKVVSEEDADLRTVLPGKPTRVPFVWQKSPLAGSYVARISIDYGNETEVIEREIRFAYVTKKAMMMAGAGLFLLVILKAYLARKK